MDGCFDVTSRASLFTSHRHCTGSFQTKTQSVSTKLLVEDPQQHSEVYKVDSSQNQFHCELWSYRLSFFVGVISLTRIKQTML